MSELVPPRITLAIPDDPMEELGPDLLDLCSALPALGFIHCGDFAIPEFMGMPMAGFVRQSDGVLAAAYSHPMAGAWIDFCVAYENGGSITVSNAPGGAELDQRPGHAKLYSPSRDLDELLGLLADLRDDTPFLVVDPGNFRHVYERWYEEEAAWRNDRGVNEREVARVAEAMEEDVSDYAVHRTVRRYEEPDMTGDEAWEVLTTWPSLTGEDELPVELLDRFEQASDYFIHNPDSRCLPMFLRCLNREEDEGLGLFVTEVFEEHPHEECVEVLDTALRADSRVTRLWAAHLACSFPDAALVPALDHALSQAAPLEETFQCALMALEDIADTGDDAAAQAISRNVARAVDLAREQHDKGTVPSPFLILLSLAKHLGPGQDALYEATRARTEESGYPVAEMEELHAEVHDILDENSLDLAEPVGETTLDLD